MLPMSKKNANSDTELTWLGTRICTDHDRELVRRLDAIASMNRRNRSQELLHGIAQYVEYEERRLAVKSGETLLGEALREAKKQR